MENRKRNTAMVCLFAFLYVLLGFKFGFFTVTGVIILWLGWRKIRAGEPRMGYFVIAVGIVMLLHDHLLLVVAILVASMIFFYYKSGKTPTDHTFLHKRNVMESIYWDKDQWILQNMYVRSVIGEFRLDLSLALIDEEETTIILQGVIGDIDIIVPDDLGFRVDISTVFGHTSVVREKETGILTKMQWQSPNYNESDHRIHFILSYMVGDIDIKTM